MESNILKKIVICICVLYYSFVPLICLQIRRTLSPGIDAYAQLSEFGLLTNKSPVRLHLGCGQQYLQGYLNIDYPLTEHTVQAYSVADVFADITKISFVPGIIDEVRLHHVFEHFDRPMAIALLCAWHMWLKPGGLLYIEVPDFLTSAKMVLDDNYSYLQKQVILRHIFGSHEASWAMHYDGWYKEKFEHILGLLGFEGIVVDHSSWKLIHNVTVRAKKLRNLGSEELKKQACQILSESMVDNGDQKMCEVWCQKFEEKLFLMLIK